jgi:tRNA threonylcarbamoyladenosine biosynthesis protein TsaB
VILAIRTDKPEAELYLYTKEGKLIESLVWQAHRQLGQTLHTQIVNLLRSADAKRTDLTGVIAYEGPGSFTGLRIGISVANALASSYKLPVIGSSGLKWQEHGLKAISIGRTLEYVSPKYGSPARTTAPKK